MPEFRIRKDQLHYATATQRHLPVTEFQMKPTSSRAVLTVVVGKGTVLASKDEPQLRVLVAVPVMAIVRR